MRARIYVLPAELIARHFEHGSTHPDPDHVGLHVAYGILKGSKLVEARVVHGATTTLELKYTNPAWEQLTPHATIERYPIQVEALKPADCESFGRVPEDLPVAARTGGTDECQNSPAKPRKKR